MLPTIPKGEIVENVQQGFHYYQHDGVCSSKV